MNDKNFFERQISRATWWQQLEGRHTHLQAHQQLELLLQQHGSAVLGVGQQVLQHVLLLPLNSWALSQHDCCSRCPARQTRTGFRKAGAVSSGRA